jgi:uncharacterized protein YlaN (UPF0358 family)
MIKAAAYNNLKTENEKLKKLIKKLENERDLYCAGLEEIHDASWPGDDAVQRIKFCAKNYLDGRPDLKTKD